MRSSETSRCPRCKAEKAREAFNKNKNRRNGLQVYCRDCDTAYRIANSDKLKARKAAYYKANSEKEKARQAAYRIANSEKEKARTAAYYRANPEKARNWRDRRRTRLASLPGGPFDRRREDYQALRRAQNYLCYYCEEDPATEADHIVPIWREDATNAPENIRWSCTFCNRSKGSRTIEDWVAHLRLCHPDHPFVLRKS